MAHDDPARQAEDARLARFAAAFAHVDADSYVLFAGTTPLSGGLDAIERAAIARLPRARRERAQEVVKDFEHAVEVSWANHLGAGYRLAGIPTTTPGRAADLVRVMASVRRAVLAVMLWDELPGNARIELLGRWRPIAERAIDSMTP